MIKNGIKHEDSEYVICFLKSFNKTYNIIKTQNFAYEGFSGMCFLICSLTKRTFE